MEIFLIHVKHFSSASITVALSRMSEAERTRYAQFRRPQRALQFLVGRCLLRRVVGQKLSLPEEHVCFIDSPGKAPRLSTSTDLEFSISHSGEWVALAISTVGKVGLDIEDKTRVRDFNALAKHVFPAEIAEEIINTATQDQGARFYQYWTAFEAQIKLGRNPQQTWHIPHPVLAIALCCDRQIKEEPVVHQVVDWLEHTPNPFPHTR